MVEVTKEQIEEVIKRFQSYAYWFYLSDKAEESFKKECLASGSKVASVSITEEGLYRIELHNGQFCLYEAKIVMGPAKEKGSLDNIVCMTNMTTPSDMSPENLKLCEGFKNSIAQVFSQAIAMKFFGYLGSDRRSRITQILSNLIPYPETEKKNE